MSGATNRARRRRASERANARFAEHIAEEHGYEVRCPHCGAVRAVGELHEWEEEVNAAGPDHPLLPGLRSMRTVAGQHDLIAFCRHCGCIAMVVEPGDPEGHLHDRQQHPTPPPAAGRRFVGHERPSTDR